MFSLFQAKNNCYCAFCKTPRRIYRKKNISVMNVVASAMAAIVLMFAIWQEFDPRAIIAFVVCLAISETFVQIRWRLSVVCRTCGFDPILYTKDPEAAATKVRAQLDMRKEDPKYLLAKPLNLPAIPAAKAKALQAKEKGKLVSRSI
ncbi:hypothetical protein [Bdellovibrio sp. NC01]|uniref:hypothetical protein n=1 Tax=Bdellovibrio sp. NC01 TaxID=2220073 RepID=UPI0011596E90|nr:hypothetical protein [Bdellovibrio sp. NC01]QDK37413.1 hypothetical protein DOE51_07345 [Bdellovibrio sp. NC01]